MAIDAQPDDKNDIQRSETLNAQEQRIVDAIVAALDPRFEVIETRLDVIETRLDVIETDMKSLRKDFDSSGEIWRQMHSDVDDLLQSQNMIIDALREHGIMVHQAADVRQTKRS